MRRKKWYDEFEKDDDLDIAKLEVQELEDDEISLSEAAFYDGYMDTYYEEEVEDYY